MSDSKDSEAPDGTAPWDQPGKVITGISTEAFTAATGLWDGLMEAPRSERIELLAKFFDKFAAEERDAFAKAAGDLARYFVDRARPYEKREGSYFTGLVDAYHTAAEKVCGLIPPGHVAAAKKAMDAQNAALRGDR